MELPDCVLEVKEVTHPGGREISLIVVWCDVEVAHYHPRAIVIWTDRSKLLEERFFER